MPTFNPQIVPNSVNLQNTVETSVLNYRSEYAIPTAVPLYGVFNQYNVSSKPNTSEPEKQQKEIVIPKETNLQVIDEDQDSDRWHGLIKSNLGGKIAENIVFSIRSGSYTIPDSENVLPDENGYFVFDKCLISIKQQKKIVETQIIGKNGTIKEYIGLGDYDITLEATIFGTNGRYPTYKMNQLLFFLNCRFPIPVICPYLNVMNINYLIVKSWDKNMEQGGISQQHLTINCVSDTLYDNDIFSPYSNDLGNLKIN